MNKSWMPVAAGIIDILSGASSIIISGYTIVNLPLGAANAETFFLGAVLVFIAGVLAIVGGVYAFRMKKWYFALTGAITASVALVLISLPLSWEYGGNLAPFLIVILGIATIILTVLARKQFERR